MNTQSIENALNELDNNTLAAIYQNVNGYDGEFGECVTYDLDELLDLFEPVSPDMVRELIKLGDCDYYYLDQTYGLMGYASVGDYLDMLRDRVVDLAEYLGENAIACWIDTDGDIKIEVFGECPDSMPDTIKRALVIDVLGDQGIYDLPDADIDNLIDQIW